jgi:DMSO/TMAO reductase YedYZ molybdopterin-dependent catalytic subunit
MSKLLTRRSLLIGGGVAAGGLIAANWHTLAQGTSYDPLLRVGENFSMHAQRLAMLHRPLAKEYRRDQISAHHPSNGGIGALYIDPNPSYQAMAQRNFRDWRLKVGGLVQRPLTLSLDQLLALPSRSQITMHSCDEGWSAIAEWTGVQLSRVLAMSGVQPEARYVVFRCLDFMGKQQVWGSIDMLEAVHPQTLLAHTMNGIPLPIGHGAPLRLRLELQIGYKNLKHLSSIELVKEFPSRDGGWGGLFEKSGYQWYAGQ